jgi:hypothetical protein
MDRVSQISFRGRLDELVIVAVPSAEGWCKVPRNILLRIRED